MSAVTILLGMAYIAVLCGAAIALGAAIDWLLMRWHARRKLRNPLRRFHVSKTMAPISFSTELLADYGITDPEAEGFVRDELDMGWRLTGDVEQRPRLLR